MSASAILILGLALVLALPLAWRALARRLDPFEPLVLFALAYGAMFVARPASMLVHGELSYGEVDLRRTFPAATALALAGGVAFLCGYELRAGAALARRLPPPRRIATRAAVTCSLALTVLAALALLALVTRFSGLSALRILVHGRSEEEARLSHESSYVWYAARLFVPAALCLLALALRERSRRIGVAAALLIAASLLVTIPLGSRIFLLPLLGGIFVLVYVRRGTRPSPLLLAVLAVAALFASYAAVIVREPERRQNAGAQFALLVHRPYHLFDLILYRGDAEMAPVLAGALTVVPERFGYRYGRASVGEIVVRPIPRQLWHGKPEPGDERIVAAVWPRLSGHFHPAFSSLLSFYWDFGIAGVMWGMAVFGIGCRALYEWFRRHADSFAAQLIYSAALWYVVVGVRDQPVDTIVLASFVVLPLILLERFSASRWASVRRSLARARVSQR